MNNYDFKKIHIAKEMYDKNPNDIKIKFHYAKMINDIDVKKRLFLELLDTERKNYALLELGKLASLENDYVKAEKYLEELLDMNLKDRKFALLELGKLEKLKGNLVKARIYFEEILKFENNNYALFELGRLEVLKGHFKKARKYFTKLLNTSSNTIALIELCKLENQSGNYNNLKLYLNKLLNTEYEDFALTWLINLELKSGNYENAFKNLCEAISKNIKINDDIILEISRKLNVFFNIDYNTFKYNYTLNQIVDYDEYEAIEHIINRHLLEDNISIFNEDIDIYKLFNDIKNKLRPYNRNKQIGFNDIYIIFYPNIGSKDENILKVVTLPNSNNILTMYPVENEKVLTLKK